jgi:hypothetical protein
VIAAPLSAPLVNATESCDPPTGLTIDVIAGAEGVIEGVAVSTEDAGEKPTPFETLTSIE